MPIHCFGRPNNTSDVLLPLENLMHLLMLILPHSPCTRSIQPIALPPPGGGDCESSPGTPHPTHHNCAGSG